jgi:hypothetical protein
LDWEEERQLRYVASNHQEEQVSHTDAPGPLKAPFAQGRHVLAPPVLKVPLGQSIHDWPMSANFPGMHAVHSAAP